MLTIELEHGEIKALAVTANLLMVGLWVDSCPLICHLLSIPNTEGLRKMRGWLWKRPSFRNCPGKILTILFSLMIIILHLSCSLFQWSPMVTMLRSGPRVRCQYLAVAVCKLCCDYTQLSNCLIYRCFADMLFSNVCDCRELIIPILAHYHMFAFNCLIAAGGNNRWCILCCCRTPPKKPLPC